MGRCGEGGGVRGEGVGHIILNSFKGVGCFSAYEIGQPKRAGHH